MTVRRPRTELLSGRGREPLSARGVGRGLAVPCRQEEARGSEPQGSDPRVPCRLLVGRGCRRSQSGKRRRPYAAAEFTVPVSIVRTGTGTCIGGFAQPAQELQVRPFSAQSTSSGPEGAPPLPPPPLSAVSALSDELRKFPTAPTIFPGLCPPSPSGSGFGHTP